MTTHTPRWMASAVLKLIARGNDALAGDLEEQVRGGRSWRWCVFQIGGILARSRRVQAAIAVALLAVMGLSVGWWGTTRLAVPVVLGCTFTSWKLWRMHRTSLILLYAASVALVLPHWMIGSTLVTSAGDRVFWAIARVLAGYGVVGILMVPFLILRLGRSGPLAERPISLSLSR